MSSPSELTQGSPEWHAWRRTGVGASEVPAILGACPYNTPHGVWLVKTGRSKGFEGNSFTQHGIDTEAKARARYEFLNMDDMPPALATHPKYPICRASLDGLRSDNKLILEIKCPKGSSVFDAAMKGEVAEHYWPQVQYQLAVTGADLLHFFVYHEESQQHALVEVMPDLVYQGVMIAKVLEFWDRYVLTDTPPPLTERDVKVIDDDSEIAARCETLKKFKDLWRKADVDRLKADIMALAQHPKMRCGNVQISAVNRMGKLSYHKLTISEVS